MTSETLMWAVKKENNLILFICKLALAERTDWNEWKMRIAKKKKLIVNSVTVYCIILVASGVHTK